jgi:hypothetical protein
MRSGAQAQALPTGADRQLRRWSKKADGRPAAAVFQGRRIGPKSLSCGKKLYDKRESEKRRSSSAKRNRRQTIVMVAGSRCRWSCGSPTGNRHRPPTVAPATLMTYFHHKFH